MCVRYAAMCSLSDNIYDYPFVSQGKVTVPSIDDSEEMQMADVRSFWKKKQKKKTNCGDCRFRGVVGGELNNFIIRIIILKFKQREKKRFEIPFKNFSKFIFENLMHATWFCVETKFWVIQIVFGIEIFLK